jgi:hypothetical protein
VRLPEFRRDVRPTIAQLIHGSPAEQAPPVHAREAVR